MKGGSGCEVREQPRASIALLGGGGAEVVDTGPSNHRADPVVADHRETVGQRVGVGLHEHLADPDDSNDDGETETDEDQGGEDEEEPDGGEQDLADGGDEADGLERDDAHKTPLD